MASKRILQRLSAGHFNWIFKRNVHRGQIFSSGRSECTDTDYFRESDGSGIPFTKYGGRYTVSMLPGVGIGPELMECVQRVCLASHVPIDFEILEFPKTDEEDPLAFQNALLSIRRNQVAIKGNIETKSKLAEEGSRNVKLRRSLDLFAYITECKSIPGVNTEKKQNLNVTLIRENSEGEYLMLEHSPVPGTAESLKVVTKPACLRIARFAFEYCKSRKRQKITVVHNSMYQTRADQVFVAAAFNVAREYPHVKLDIMAYHNCIFQLEHAPHTFDVILCPNLYGVVFGSVLGGLAGGPGLLSGTNYGPQAIIFEPGARNKGTTIQGKGLANPIAMLKCAMDMLVFLGHDKYALLIYEALGATLKEGISTPDIGGTATTEKVIDTMVKHIERMRLT